MPEKKKKTFERKYNTTEIISIISMNAAEIQNSSAPQNFPPIKV